MGNQQGRIYPLSRIHLQKENPLDYKEENVI